MISVNKSGIVLIVAIFTMMVFALLLITVINMQSSSFDANVRTFNSERALFTAEAGSQWALNQLHKDLNWRTDSSHGYTNGYASHKFGPGEYQVICRNPQATEHASAIIISTGFVPKQPFYLGKRIIKLLVDTGLGFNFGVFAGESVSMSGQAKIDSYNSSEGPYDQFGNKWNNGDVGTNGDISASGQAYIYGNADTGPWGKFNDTKYVWGAITHTSSYNLPTVSIPSTLVNLTNSGSLTKTQTVDPGNYKHTSIDLSGQKTLTIIGPVNMYLTGNPAINITGQAQIVIDALSTGPVTMYADKDISISGQGIANNTNLPKNFILYGSGAGSSISITGQGNFYGGIIAPNADLNISGQGNLFGAFIGKTVDLSGQAFIHYDESMKTLPLFEKKVNIASWAEQ